MTILPPLEGDPRLAEGLRLLEAGEWLEASDLFEELYFEAVRDEVPLVRVCCNWPPPSITSRWDSAVRRANGWTKRCVRWRR